MKKIVGLLVLLFAFGLVFGQNASDEEVTLTTNYTECTPEYGINVNTNEYSDGVDEFDMPTYDMQTNLGFDVAVEGDGAGGYQILGDSPSGYYNLDLNYNIYCAGDSQTMTISIDNELEGVSFSGSASTYNPIDYTSSSKEVTISTTTTDLFSGLEGNGNVSLSLSAQVTEGATVSSLDSQSATLVVTLINDN